MTNNLTGSTALVTGGNSGIGRAAALTLAELGAHVVLSGRDTARGEQVVAAIRAQGGRADFVATELNDEASARQLAKQATDLGGGHGSIINVTTMVAESGMAEMGLYGSSKAALVLLAKSWAAEYGPAGARVNAVSPGPTRTEGTAGVGEALDQLASAAPGGRPGLPEEIAAAITYLASDAASFVHGAVFPADGGRIAV
ncbi:MAG TPA: SDR family oxidoreductase [Streptosporangiaceae bacterium]|nr:SDR family oxidoreductase [Streptosporangiaceae bacterium]